jgi:hypothetical protein
LGQVAYQKIWDKQLTAAEVATLYNGPAGIAESTKPVFNVYPNPSGGSITINAGTTHLAYIITDCTGRTVMNGTLYGIGTLNLQELKPGIYLINDAGGAHRPVKLVKNR